jgi:hypothetical protein
MEMHLIKRGDPRYDETPLAALQRLRSEHAASADEACRRAAGSEEETRALREMEKDNRESVRKLDELIEKLNRG